MRIKYNRTYHLPWSEGRTDDDKVMTDISCFIGKNIIITEKMDGENTTVYSDGFCHARSTDSKNHPSRNWLKNNIQEWCYKIPHGWRVCGENLYAKHSISYNNLPSFFLVFGIYDENNICLSWSDTETICKDVGLYTVQVMSKIEFDETFLQNITIGSKQEGYVIRNSEAFSYDDFSLNVAKYVRANHVQTDEHWMNSTIVLNKLKENK